MAILDDLSETSPEAGGAAALEPAMARAPSEAEDTSQPSLLAASPGRRAFAARRIVVWVLFVLGYALLERGAQIATGQVGAGAAWDLAGGLAFALLVVEGPVAIPVVVLADFVDDFLLPGVHPPLFAGLGAAVGIAASYGVAAAWLRSMGVRRLQSQRELVLLTAAAVAASLTHAIADLAFLGFWSSVPAAGDWPTALPLAWTGSLVGIMVIAPLAMLPPLDAGTANRRTALEVAAMLMALLAVMAFVFPALPRDLSGYFFLLFLPQIWIAARFGVWGAVMGDLLVQAGLAAAFLSGDHQTDLMFALEFRFLALVATTLFLGAAVTDRRRLEATLRRRQEELARVSRLSLAGEMAGALAHQLNQPLLAAMAFARSAQRLLAQPAAVRDSSASEAMSEAVAQVERAGSIVRSLRAFIGRSEPAQAVFSLDELVRETAQLIAADCAKVGARLEVVIDHSSPRASADPVQVQQVLINLARNALDALEVWPGPRRVTFTVRRGPEGALEAEVGDSGPGVSPRMAAQLFEPFASDKAGGIGLGLAISRRLAEAQGGRLWLAENAPGRCRFCFTVPPAKGRRRAR